MGNGQYSRWLEILLCLLTLKLDDGREHQHHVPPLVHNGCVAVRAADLAGQVMIRMLLLCMVESQALGAVLEVQILFLEDGGPLEGCAYIDMLVLMCCGIGDHVHSYGLKNLPCKLWQSVQWQYLDARGFSRLNQYLMRPQLHSASWCFVAWSLWLSVR